MLPSKSRLQTRWLLLLTVGLFFFLKTNFLLLTFQESRCFSGQWLRGQRLGFRLWIASLSAGCVEWKKESRHCRGRGWAEKEATQSQAERGTPQNTPESQLWYEQGWEKIFSKVLFEYRNFQSNDVYAALFKNLSGVNQAKELEKKIEEQRSTWVKILKSLKEYIFWGSFQNANSKRILWTFLNFQRRSWRGMAWMVACVLWRALSAHPTRSTLPAPSRPRADRAEIRGTCCWKGRCNGIGA